ncbi:uncharacterized protein GGS25DRAFT_498096 [Hypoxylon fragiforme]|uniref:uncharacterized protein n=1 Tax=Hypoxylon fragiforme TaxID=63214 RepID=UPI0020C6886F|nr:uncharacterized protein GGS25DRAFT_498096 [Hypoxylon fragiforme]KAI2605798.1 hypothetical protein GGS25DRAFT_498096 [Hypoxylon fragiforme]
MQQLINMLHSCVCGLHRCLPCVLSPILGRVGILSDLRARFSLSEPGFFMVYFNSLPFLSFSPFPSFLLVSTFSVRLGSFV